jgi:predicted amidohydrolase YtcJ
MNKTEYSVIILNANVITLNSKQPRAEAIAIENEKIVAVGSNEQILTHKSKNTETIDCKNKTVVPGLVDCHIHMLEFGFLLQELNLRSTKSIKEMQNSLRKHVERKPELEWILGGRWDEEKFSEKRYPTRWDLDKIVSHKPVFLKRVCGHLVVVNSKALRLAQITRSTKVNGGVIDLDEATGEPTGILRDNAIDLVSKLVPTPSRSICEKACISACNNAVKAGLTGVHWLVDSAEEVQVLQSMASEGRLPLRVNLGIPVKMLKEMTHLGLTTGFGSDMLKLGFIKILADGSLGARTAALENGYSDDSDKRGIMLYSQRKLHELILEAHKNGWQVAVHAIGDRALRKVIEAMNETLRKVPRKDHRHRIEHCSIMNEALISQMKELHLIASVQPHFVVSDVWTVNRIGIERTRWAYPFKTLFDKGIVVVSGSDCPIELISPLLGLWAAVKREDKPEESLTVEEALRTFTVNAAFASFDEAKKGTIEAGKYADLTILEEDITKIPFDRIRNLMVEMVIVNGKVRFANK